MYADSVVVGHRVRGNPVFTVAFPYLDIQYAWPEFAFQAMVTGITTVADNEVLIPRLITEIVRRVMIEFVTRVTNGRR